MSLANTGVLPVALLWPCRDFKWLLTPSFIGLVSKHPASPILVMGRSKKFLRRITFLVKQDDELWGEIRGWSTSCMRLTKRSTSSPRSRLTFDPRGTIALCHGFTITTPDRIYSSLCDVRRRAKSPSYILYQRGTSRSLEAHRKQSFLEC